MSDHLPYRPCVGIALFNAEGLVWVGERIDNPGAWQMPQGGIDDGETLEEATMRELLEEVGSNDIEILKIAEEKTRYDVPPELQQKLWSGRYRGQEQSWVAARFLGEDHNIDLEYHDPPEFSAWQWVKLHQTLELIVPFKQETYSQVIKMFEEFSN